MSYARGVNVRFPNRDDLVAKIIARQNPDGYFGGRFTGGQALPLTRPSARAAGPPTTLGAPARTWLAA